MAAYYCFVNHGWPPSKYESLPYRERVLISVMTEKELQSRKNIEGK